MVVLKREDYWLPKKYPEGDKVVSYQKRGHLEMQTDPSYILPFLFQKRTHKDRQHFRRRNYQGEQKQSLKRHLSNKKQFILIAHTWIESGYYYYLYYLGIRASFSSFVKCLGRKKKFQSHLEFWEINRSFSLGKLLVDVYALFYLLYLKQQFLKNNLKRKQVNNATSSNVIFLKTSLIGHDPFGSHERHLKLKI